MPILELLFLTVLPVCAQNESKAITEWRVKVADEARWAQPKFDDQGGKRAEARRVLTAAVPKIEERRAGLSGFRGIV